MSDRESLLALGRRAINAEGWRWMPGMLACHPTAHPGLRLVDIEDGGNALQEHGWFPDLSDDATKGCLLRLIRDKHDDDEIIVIKSGRLGTLPEHWMALRTDGMRLTERMPTEIEALVAALEADRV
jgi:hypothetical protein